MKLRDVAKGTWAVKPVTIRLANAIQAAPPGQPPSREPVEFKLGVRVLTGAETAEVYQKAAEDARVQGVEQWDDDNPVCRLHLMVHTLARAGVDVDQVTGQPADPRNPTPWVADADEIRESQLLGTENIIHLHEQWIQWQDECSPRFKVLPFEEMVSAIHTDLRRPEGDASESPLASWPHATLVSCVRILGALLLSSPTDKSPSGTRDDSPSTPTSETAPSEPKKPDAAPGTKTDQARRRARNRKKKRS